MLVHCLVSRLTIFQRDAKMKVLVTGGAGFIGSHIVDELINNGHTAVVVDNFSTGDSAFVNEKAKIYEADITNTRDIRNIIKKEKPHIINHHAAQSSLPYSMKKPQMDAKINILGSLNLLNLSVEFNVKRFIFASSCAVYGKVQLKDLPLLENHPTNPATFYGISKKTVEDYMKVIQEVHGLQCVALRYGNVYGPRQKPKGESGVVPLFIESLKNNRCPVIIGDGYQTRDFVHVSDVASANVLAMMSPKTGIYNIGTGVETSIWKVFYKIQSKLKSDAYPEMKEDFLKLSAERVRLWNNKFYRDFSWRPKVDFSKGIDELIEYDKRNN